MFIYSFGSVMNVGLRKCRISVFCTLFLVLFLLGTICGVLLFRLLCSDQDRWILAYSRILSADGLSGSCLFSWVPGLKEVSAGLAIVICTVAAAAICALVCPVEEEAAE